jgi:ADP-heptose:LPS heptosyltransferase
MFSALPVFGKPLPEMTGSYRARNWRIVALLRALDCVGRLFPQRRKPLPDRPLKVLVANWGHLGDVVTLLPLLKYLENDPRVGALGMLMGSWSRGVLAATDIRADIHIMDSWMLDRRPGGKAKKFLRYFVNAPALIRELKKWDYDVSIDTFSTFPVSHGLTRLAGIPCRIGFDSAGFGTLLTHPVAWLPADMPILEQQLRLLEPLLGARGPAALPASYPGFAPVALPADLGIDGGGHIVLHMGAGDPIKGWDTAKWVELTRALRERGETIVFSGAAGPEAALAAAIADQTGFRSVAGRLSWAQFVTLVARAKAVICVDTVIGHVAACFSVPTVVLTTGRARAAFWRPNNPRAALVTYPVGCQPCNRTKGCESMACIRRIDVPRVLSAYDGLAR